MHSCAQCVTEFGFFFFKQKMIYKIEENLIWMTEHRNGILLLLNFSLDPKKERDRQTERDRERGKKKSTDWKRLRTKGGKLNGKRLLEFHTLPIRCVLFPNIYMAHTYTPKVHLCSFYQKSLSGSFKIICSFSMRGENQTTLFFEIKKKPDHFQDIQMSYNLHVIAGSSSCL